MATQTTFPYSGAIDADGHILEPPDIWEKYIDPQYRDRAIRLRTNAHGLEYLEIDGRPFKYMPAGSLAAFGAMGKKPPDRDKPDPSMTYVGEAPFGSMDAQERVRRLDQEGLEKAILYPSIGLIWETEEVGDLAYQAALTTAYNRWITEFCADTNGRLIPVAHISMGDPHEAAKELERSVKAGARGSIFCAVHADG